MPEPTCVLVSHHQHNLAAALVALSQASSHHNRDSLHAVSVGIRMLFPQPSSGHRDTGSPLKRQSKEHKIRSLCFPNVSINRASVTPMLSKTNPAYNFRSILTGCHLQFVAGHDAPTDGSRHTSKRTHRYSQLHGLQSYRTTRKTHPAHSRDIASVDSSIRFQVWLLRTTSFVSPQ